MPNTLRVGSHHTVVSLRQSPSTCRDASVCHVSGVAVHQCLASFSGCRHKAAQKLTRFAEGADVGIIVT